MKSYLHILYALILAFILSSCNAKHQDTSKTTFRYNQVGGLETLDPAFAKNISIMWGVHFIYNTLVEVDSNLNITSSLAKSWQISEDGLNYTFIIRDDIYFQDNEVFKDGLGRKMTAKDIEYSFNRIIDGATASSGAWIFNDRVKEKNPFKAIDDTTFVIELQAPFTPLLQILSMPYCSVIPFESVDKWGKDFRSHPCGTGPYQFKYWDEGNTLVLEKNQKYWEFDAANKRLPYIDAVQVSFSESKATEFLLFLQGNLDFVTGLDGSFKDIVLNKNGTLKSTWNDKINLKKKVYLNTEYLGILTDTSSTVMKGSPLLNKQIRQAINYAIDRDKIITYFRNGIGVAAKGGFVPEGMPGVDKSIVPKYEYDPSKSLALLAAAGFPNGKGLPSIVLSTPDGNVDICNFVARQLNDVGIKTKVQVMQPGLLRQEMSRSNAPFFKAQWIADYPDAETYLAFFYSKFPAPPNYTRFNNRTFDRWYEQSLTTNDDTLRLRLYAKMDSLVSEEVPLVPLFYDELMHFTHKNISGLTTNSLNMIDIKRAIIQPKK